MKINTAVGSIKINRDAKLNINQDLFIVQIVLLFLGATGSEIKIYQSIAIDGLATTGLDQCGLLRYCLQILGL